VRSLTLRSVGVDPAHDGQAQYYAQRRLLSSDQHTILRQMVDYLLGYPPENITESLIQVLEQDLYQSLSLHSLMRSTSLLPISVDVPLLVCGSVDDEIIDPSQLQDWKQYWRHSASRLWICPGGRYFFHCFYPQQVSEQIIQFWKAVPSSPRSYAYQHVKEAIAWRTSKY
jgi:surfactin synthase thioesterase subunit